MKFSYIANITLPSGKTHPIQIMEMCQALSRQGLEVELVVRATQSHITEDPFKFYDITPNFTIKRLWCIKVIRIGRIGFWLESLTFSLSVLFYALKNNHIFYSRDEIVVFFLSLIRKNVFWEAHMGHKNLLVRTVILLKVRTVVITDALKELYVSLGLPSENILIAPDGADIDRFDISISKEEARKKLNLPAGKKIVLYKGSLETWKGASIIALATQYIKTDNVLFIFIGGKPGEVEKFRNNFSKISNILIAGKVSRKETPIYQKAADICVISNSAIETISRLYTSPMKLFGYMAGGRPIVSADLPSLREVLSESNASFFTPDEPDSLAKSIDLVFENYNERTKKMINFNKKEK